MRSVTHHMRYLVASIACLCLVLIFATVRVFVFGVADQPGAVPLVILFALMLLTWRAITKKPSRA